MGMPIDFAAEGLLDEAGDERSREARLELLRTLEAEGFGLEELRRAARDGRLTMLPVERVLAAEGARYTQRELAEETGLDLDFMDEARRAVGAPAVDPDEPVLTEEDRELALNGAALLQSGLDRERFMELICVMSNAMAGVAASFASIWGEALMRAGDTERDLGLRYAESLRSLGPLAAPTLQHMLNLRLREVIRQVVVSQAELQSGLPGAHPVTVAFVDIVGFTELGEGIPPEELGSVVRDFERAVEDAVRAPVRLVKTIGDAAMLVAPDPGPVVEVVVDLVEASRASENRPLLRGGIASGEALLRAGDWYGRPVNLAARLTEFARRGSVVASAEVHDAAADGHSWSFAGRRRLKGVSDEIEVYRVRRPAATGSSRSTPRRASADRPRT
jgi:adenylate cyclase